MVPLLSRLGKGQGVRWWHILTWFLSLHTFTYPPHMSTLSTRVPISPYIEISRYQHPNIATQCKEMCKIANEPGVLKASYRSCKSRQINIEIETDIGLLVIFRFYCRSWREVIFIDKSQAAINSWCNPKILFRGRCLLVPHTLIKVHTHAYEIKTTISQDSKDGPFT